MGGNMIGALDSSYTFNPLMNASSGDAAQTSSAEQDTGMNI